MANTFTLEDSEQPLSGEAAEIIGDIPEVQQHAIDAFEQTQETKEDANSGSAKPDNAGVLFNPSLHASGDDGNGIITARGTWRKKRGTGSRVASSVASKTTKEVSPASGANASPAPLTSEQIAAARQAGIAAAESMFMCGRMLGGEEWNPMVETHVLSDGKKTVLDERTYHHEVWGNYFVAKGVTDFPPGLALFMALSMYVGRRVNQPVTAKKVKGVKNRLKAWWIKRALKKKGIKAEVTIEDGEVIVKGEHSQWSNKDGTRVNTGNDPQR